MRMDQPRRMRPPLPFLYFKDAHASHIKQVASPGMRDADEHFVARRTAYDCPYAMHVGGSRPNRMRGAATGAGDLGERHFEREDGLQNPCGRIAIQLVFHHGSPVGPKRSVLMRTGSCPSSTRLAAAVSTNGVGPQIYASGR